MAVTIKDIAKQLNLSVSTVSYALNGGPKPVSEAVRIAVKAAALELGYRPNRVARSLVTRRCHTIGIVPPETRPHQPRGSFFHEVLNSLVNSAEEFSYDILILTAFDRSTPGGFANELLDSRIDGLIFIAPPKDSATLNALADLTFPYAVIASTWRGRGPCFESDNEQGTRLAFQHLVSLGHTKIAHVTGRTSATDSDIRLATFKHCMADSNLELPEEYIVPGDYSRAAGGRAMQHFLQLENRPTAIYCANDETAFGLIEAARAAGLDIPKDLSVIGFDDAALSKAFVPPLTTVRQPLEDMASDAFKSLIRHIETGEPSSGHTYLTELIVRYSTKSVDLRPN